MLELIAQQAGQAIAEEYDLDVIVLSIALGTHKSARMLCPGCKLSYVRTTWLRKHLRNTRHYEPN